MSSYSNSSYASDPDDGSPHVYVEPSRHVDDVIAEAMKTPGEVYEAACGCAAWSNGETFVLRELGCDL